jgi:hypothetical protein
MSREKYVEYVTVPCGVPCLSASNSFSHLEVSANSLLSSCNRSLPKPVLLSHNQHWTFITRRLSSVATIQIDLLEIGQKN